MVLIKVTWKWSKSNIWRPFKQNKNHNLSQEQSFGVWRKISKVTSKASMRLDWKFAEKIIGLMICELTKVSSKVNFDLGGQRSYFKKVVFDQRTRLKKFCLNTIIFKFLFYIRNQNWPWRSMNIFEKSCAYHPKNYI